MYQSSYELNFVPGGVPLTIHISQYDVGLRQFHFTPTAVPGQMATVSGAVATLEATKPDGNAVVQSCTYNNDGTIDYVVQEQLAAVAGKVWSKIVLRSGADVIGAAAIVWMVDRAGVADDASLSDSDISGLEGYVDQLKTLVGTPIAVTTAAGMTDHGKLYLYEGSESGYTAGDWYYWDGSAWTSGGEYGSGAVEIDPTLSIAGEAADAKATGDGLDELKNDIAKSFAGNCLYLEKPTYIKVTPVAATNIWAINNEANILKRSSSSLNVGRFYTSSANNYVNISKAKNTSSLNNRWYLNGAFDTNADGKGKVYTATGTTVVVNALAFVRTIPSGAKVRVGTFDSSQTNLGRIEFTESGLYRLEITVTANQDIYMTVGDSSAPADAVLDADIFITVSDKDEIVPYTNGVLYNKMLLIGDGKINVEYVADNKNNNNEISVCAYNVGGFANGGGTPAGTDESHNKFIDTFNSAQDSCFLFSEWNPDFNANVTAEEVFGGIRKYWSSRNTVEENGYVLQRVASQYPIEYECFKYFINQYNSAERRNFVDSVIILNGYNIHLIATHLSYRSTAVRHGEITELINYIQNNNIEYAIIGGDFNNGLSSEVDPPETEEERRAIAAADTKVWTDAGFISAQKSCFGDMSAEFFINTKTGSENVRPYDNIVITPNMQFLTVKTITNNESDHMAIMASIKIE